MLGGRGLLGSAALSAALLMLVGCSDRPMDSGATAPPVAGESGYFVDSAHLDKVCVGSGVTYPIVTDERRITGANPGPTDTTIAKLHREALAKAWGVYPRKFFEAIGFREIILCRSLAVDGTACYTFSDVEDGRLFLNLDSGIPDGFTRRTLHHEVYHFLDYAEDGRLDEDRAWSALNPPEFLYGSGGASMQQDAGAGRLDESLVGFVNRYSTSGLAEDKAEVYASLIFDAPWMARRASDDPVIGRKVDKIRASLRRFGPIASGLLPRGR